MEDVTRDTLGLMSATYKTSIFEQHLSYLKFDYEQRVAQLIEARRLLLRKKSAAIPPASFEGMWHVNSKITKLDSMIVCPKGRFES